MMHKNEDELLAYALEVVASDEEHAGIAAHLEVCSECRARLQSIKTDIEAIGGVRPSPTVSHVLASHPHPSTVWTPEAWAQRFSAYGILRAAALITVGVVIGFGASSRLHREPILVSPAYVKVSPPATLSRTTAMSDATDVPAEYYQRILEESERP